MHTIFYIWISIAVVVTFIPAIIGILTNTPIKRIVHTIALVLGALPVAVALGDAMLWVFVDVTFLVWTYNKVSFMFAWAVMILLYGFWLYAPRDKLSSERARDNP